MQTQICFEIKHKLMQTHIAVLWRWQRKNSMRESQRKTNKIYIYCQKSEIKINWSVAIDVKSGSCGCLYIKRGCGVSNNALKCFSIVSIYLNLNIQLHLFDSNDPQKKWLWFWIKTFETKKKYITASFGKFILSKIVPKKEVCNFDQNFKTFGVDVNCHNFIF